MNNKSILENLRSIDVDNLHPDQIEIINQADEQIYNLTLEISELEHNLILARNALIESVTRERDLKRELAIANRLLDQTYKQSRFLNSMADGSL